MKRTIKLLALILALLMAMPAAWAEELPVDAEAEQVEALVEEIELELGEAEPAEEGAVETPDLLPLEDEYEEEPVEVTSEESYEEPLPDDSDIDMPEPETLVLDAAEENLEAVEDSPILLNAEEICLGVGDKFTLKAALPEGGEDAPAFTFETSRAAVATVSAAGVVTAKAVGEAEITVSCGEDCLTVCPVKVVKAPTSVKLAKAKLELALDAERGVYTPARIEATVSPAGIPSALRYTVYTKAVLDIAEDGTIIPKKAGTTYVRVQTYNNRYALCTVTVKNAPRSISLDKSALTLQERQGAKLKAALPKNTAGAVAFESLSPEIAAVDAAGNVTGLCPGEAVVAARCFNGVEALCQVTVVPGPDEVALSPAEMRLGAGDKLTLTAEALRYDGGAVDQTLTFAVDKKNVATVSAAGLATARYPGKATITATAPNGARSVCAVTVVKAPTALELSAKTLSLGIDLASGAIVPGQLTATLTPAESASAIRYSGYDPAIIEVTEDGMVIPKQAGKTTIKASTYNNRTATCAVTVQAAPDAIAMDREQLTLLERQSGAVKALLPAGTAGKITYTVAPEGIAEVNPDTGAVTALHEGEAVITATCFNGVSASCALSVLPGPDAVELSDTSRKLGMGDKFTLIATPIREDGQVTSPEVTYTTSNKTVATVSASGVVTGKYTGTAKITATAPNGVKATCTVKVVMAPWFIKLNISKVTLALDAARGVYTTCGLTSALTPANSASSIRYTGYDPAIIEVTEDGTVIPKQAGKTTVKAVTCNNRSASCAVTVLAAPESIAMDKASLTLLERQSGAVKALLPPDTAGKISYSASPEGVVEVNPDTGAVTALRMGEAVITAACFNGVTASCAVSVLPGPDTVELSDTSRKLGMGDKFTLIATPIREDGQETSPTVTYTTNNKNVATVSASGVVTGKYTGTAKITATAPNGVKATCTVKVVMAPWSIKLTPATVKLSFDAPAGLGTSARLKAELTKNTASSIRWTVSAGDCVAVSEDGLVTAVAVGTATVKATTCNGRSATCKVTVLPAPEAIELSARELNLMERQTADLKALLPAGTAGDIAFESSAPECAQVDPVTGRVAALREGGCVITATCFNGVSASCAVNVVPGPDRVEMNPEKYKIGVGDKVALVAEALRDDGAPTVNTLEWTSSASAVATVSAEGVVTAKKIGKATITAKAANGVKATCAIEVVAAPWGVTLNKTKLTLDFEPEEDIAESFQLRATPSAGSVSAIIWSGYDETIVAVSPEGVVTAVGYGTTTVTASTYNNRKAKCTVTVQRPQSVIDHYRNNHPLIAVAHRGGRAYWPENTLEAFSHTKSTGADMIELDVQTTSDGVQVIHHDQSFKANNVVYNIPSYTYEQLKAAKPGLCTLDEALELIRGEGLALQLELKNSADPSKCVDAVARHGMKDRTWYISFNKTLLTRVRALDGQARLGFIFQGAVPSGLAATVSQLRLSAVMVHQNLLTQARLDDWHRQGLMVNVWTINDAEKCKKFSKMGVDFITSDYPDYAVAAK